MDIKDCKILVKDLFFNEIAKEGTVFGGNTMIYKAARDREHQIRDKRKFDKTNISPRKILKSARNFICDLCDKAYVAKDGLEYHMRRIHLNDIYSTYEDSRQCGFCNLYFLEEEYQDHIKHSHQFLRCKTCLTVFYDEKALRRHQKTHNKNQFTCDICKYRSTLYSNMKRHILTKHLKKTPKLKCSYCDKLLAATSLPTHITMVHMKIKNSTCYICFKSFGSDYKARRHILHVHTEERPFVCDICNKSFKGSEYLQQHIKGAHGTRHNCHKCTRTFSFRENLKRHLRSHENHPFACTDCFSMFASEAAREKHFKKHHIPKKGKKQKTFNCDECKNKYTRKDALLRHKIRDHKNLKYECDICNAKFGSKSYLRIHIIKKHVKKDKK